MSKFSILSDQPISCVVFIPGYESQFVVGTYTLEHATEEASTTGNQSRRGSLLIYDLLNDTIEKTASHTIDAGVLDIAIDPRDSTRLYAATSVGSLACYEIVAAARDNTNNPSFHLRLVDETQVFDPSVLILDLEFHPTRRGVLGVTTSEGAICLVQLQQDHPPGLTEPSKVQPASPVPVSELYRCALEAWTLAFSDDGHALFFGSDDSSLGVACLRSPSDLQIDSSVSCLATDTASPLSIVHRVHDAGVVSILPLHVALPTTTPVSILITGSYDDHIRVVRPERTPYARTLAELHLGGGVWRTSLIGQWLDPQNQDRRKWLVLVACMHAGAKVIEIRCERFQEAIEGKDPTDGAFDIEVVATFEGHESMCYGAAMVPGTGTRRKVVSTSFYDKLVALWEFEGPEWLGNTEKAS